MVAFYLSIWPFQLLRLTCRTVSDTLALFILDGIRLAVYHREPSDVGPVSQLILANQVSRFRGRITMKIFHFLARLFGLGDRGEGREPGPRAGDGAVVHHSSGEADFDGLSGNVPPPIKDTKNDLPYPNKRSAD